MSNVPVGGTSGTSSYARAEKKEQADDNALELLGAIPPVPGRTSPRRPIGGQTSQGQSSASQGPSSGATGVSDVIVPDAPPSNNSLGVPGASSGAVSLQTWLNNPGEFGGSAADNGTIMSIMMALWKDAKENQLARKEETRAENAQKLQDAMTAAADKIKQLQDEKSDIQTKFVTDIVVGSIELGSALFGFNKDWRDTTSAISSTANTVGNAIKEGVEANSATWGDKAVVAKDEVIRQIDEVGVDNAKQEQDTSNDHLKTVKDAVSQLWQTIAQIEQAAVKPGG